MTRTDRTMIERHNDYTIMLLRVKASMRGGSPVAVQRNVQRFESDAFPEPHRIGWFNR